MPKKRRARRDKVLVSASRPTSYYQTVAVLANLVMAEMAGFRARGTAAPALFCCVATTFNFAFGGSIVISGT